MSEAELLAVDGGLVICPRCRPRWRGDGEPHELRFFEGTVQCSESMCGATFGHDPFLQVCKAGGLTPTPWQSDWSQLRPELVEGMPPDSAPVSTTRRLASSVWSQFRDLMPESWTPSFVTQAPMAVDLATLVEPGTQRVAVIGSEAGRLAIEAVQRGAGQVVALDEEPTFSGWMDELRGANRRLALPVPQGAVRWTRVEFPIPAWMGPAAREVAVVCGELSSPPLKKGAFDLVMIPTALDSVADPLSLLVAANDLLAPGGRLAVASPFAWQRAVTPPGARLEAIAWLDANGESRRGDAPDVLEGILTGRLRASHAFHLDLLTRWTAPWHVRVHGRHFNTYLNELFVFRRPERA